MLTIDGRVLDAASWNVKRLIWRPDVRLEERDVDLGPRRANSFAGPGWSLERRETVADSQPITFVQALTARAVISRLAARARRRSCVACVNVWKQQSAIDPGRCRRPPGRSAEPSDR